MVMWGGTLGGGCIKLGMFIELQKVINCVDFHFLQINSLRARGGQKRGFPFEMHMARTTLSCAAALASDCFTVGNQLVKLTVFLVTSCVILINKLLFHDLANKTAMKIHCSIAMR